LIQFKVVGARLLEAGKVGGLTTEVLGEGGAMAGSEGIAAGVAMVFVDGW
jgi:hypothetical protein